MIGSNIKTIKEEIVEILLKSSSSTKKIRSTLIEKKLNITPQGVYKQLNALLDEHVIIKNNKNYSISNEWIKHIQRLINIQEIELPDEGERFTYRFNSLQKLDAQWKHFISAVNKTSQNKNIYSYTSRQFWPYVPSRIKSEINYKKEHEQKKYYNFFVIGGKTHLDKKYRKIFNGDFFKVELFDIISIKRNIHITIIDDIVISSILDKELTQKIDSIYTNKQKLKEQEKQLKELFLGNHVCKIYIERNRKKSDTLRKKISKPFYISKHIQKNN